MSIENIIKELSKLTKKAKDNNEVPIAAIITCNNKIVAKAYNKTNKKNNILNHAEILVIKKASKILNNWRLDKCNLYVTLEPCSMCKEIIKKSRIKKIYYFIKQNNNATEKEPDYCFVENNDLSEELSNFFKKRR